MTYYVAQTISLFGVILFFYSVQYKNKHQILLVQSISNFLYSISYFLLNAPIAAFMNLTSVIRCYLFSRYDKKKKKIPFYYFLLFCSLIFIISIFAYSGLLSLIPIGITLLYTYSSFQKDVKKFRIIFLICSIMWMYYNYRVQAVIPLFGNLFEFSSAIISLVRYRKKGKKNEKQI